MKISSATLDFSTQHTATSLRKVSESIRAWVGASQPNTQPSPPPSISSAAVSAQTQDSATNAVTSAADKANGDPRMILIRLMVEMLTKHKIKDLFAADMQAPAASVSLPSSAVPQAAVSQPVSSGIEIGSQTVQTETEQTSFQASGTIQTSDGQVIQFQLSLDMQRSFSSESSTSLSIGAPAPVKTDPLVINFNGTAAQLQSQRFSFDLQGNGQSQDVPLLGGGSGYLALDLNGNGKIDSGKELFGTSSGNGFADLTRLDSDGNGWIDESDAGFNQLRVWTPDANGGGPLATLQEKRVGALYLGNQATPFDLKDASNQSLGDVRASGIYLSENGSVGTLQQIDLSV